MITFVELVAALVLASILSPVLVVVGCGLLWGALMVLIEVVDRIERARRWLAS